MRTPTEDTEHLIILDEKVKHKNLFGEVLIKVVLWFCVLALTSYGFFSLCLSPEALKFFKRVDNVDHEYVIGIIIAVLFVFGVWLISKRK